MGQTVLILGASGRFGRHASEAFWNAGWQVRCFDRQKDDLETAAQGVDLIVNGWNPPYPEWQVSVPELTKAVISVARARDVTVLLPGNVYVYGAQSETVLSESSPHAADNPLGRVRQDMEASYRSAGVRTIVLRAGDFIDTEDSGNWFDQVIMAKARRGIVTYPGNPEVPHAWAYLPDLARAAVAIAEKRDLLEPFEDIPFPGYTLTGRELAEQASRALGRPMRLRRMSWLPLHIARPVWPMAKHLLEMRYLWAMPHRLDDAKFNRLVPGFEVTPVEEAVRRALGQKVHPDQPVSRSGVTVAAE